MKTHFVRARSVALLSISVLAAIAGVGAGVGGGGVGRVLADEPPAAKGAPASGPKISPAARAILERAMRAEQAAQFVSGRMTFKWTMLLEGQKEEEAQTHETTQEFSVARPANVRIKSGDVSVYCDGTTLTVVSSKLHQYIQRPAPAVDKLEDQIRELSGGQIGGLPGEEVLRPTLTLEEAYERFKKIDGVKEETVGGKKGAWVSGEMGDAEGGRSIPASMFYPEGAVFPSTIRLDYKSYYEDKEMPSPDGDEDKTAKVVRAGWVVTHDQVEMDKPIPAGTFVFTPSASDKKVEEFAAGGRERPSPQNGLLGLAAPAFEGKELDGKALKLADLKGKVVVLDFWATWCGPCMAAIPKMQELKDKYEGKNVVFLGMNTDQPGSASKVKKTLEKKKITIRQFDDSEGAASEAYRITGIPCVAIIDAAGVLQSIRVGFSPDADEAIAKDIDALLGGKPLHTDEEFKTLREAKGEDGDDDEGAGAGSGGKRLELTKSSAERVVADGVLGRAVAGFTGGSFNKIVADVSGKGDDRLVLQTRTGSLVVVNKDGSGYEKLALGIGQADISRAMAVTIGSERRWLVAWQGMGRGKPHIGLFDLEGKKLWDFAPPLPSGANAWIDLSVGDFAGEARPGVAVLLSAFKFGGSNGRDYQRGSLLVLLDADGKALSQAQIGDDSSFVHVCAPEGGKPGAILIGEITGVKRWRYDPGAKTIEAAPEGEKK